jgi:GDP-L-fucose synthase
VYIDDFVRVMLKLVDTCPNDLINVGAGEEFTIREFAAQICSRVGFDPAKIHYDTTKYVGARSKCLSIRKLRGIMPDLQMTSLGEGLEKTITWFQKEQDLLLQAKG